MRAALSAVGATSREGHRTEFRKAISWLPRVGEPPKPVKFCFLDKDVGGTMCRRASRRADAWPGSAPFFVAMHATDPLQTPWEKPPSVPTLSRTARWLEHPQVCRHFIVHGRCQLGWFLCLFGHF